MGDLERVEFLTADFVEILGGIEIARVLGAELDVGIFEEPPGEAAHFPFGTGVWPGAEDDPKAFLLGNAAEFSDVGLAGPVKVARRGLTIAPEEVGADGVEA